MLASQLPSMWAVDLEGVNPVAIWTMFQMFSHGSNQKEMFDCFIIATIETTFLATSPIPLS